jgi:hypothetical protein
MSHGNSVQYEERAIYSLPIINSYVYYRVESFAPFLLRNINLGLLHAEQDSIGLLAGGRWSGKMPTTMAISGEPYAYACASPSR